MLDRGDLDKLVRALAETREREIGCDECFEQMDRFAEIEFSGSDAATCRWSMITCVSARTATRSMRPCLWRSVQGEVPAQSVVLVPAVARRRVRS
jgi:hypothetical protein